MKKQITFVMGALTIFFTACKTEPNAEAVRKEVLNIHDKLMIDGEKVVKNKMKLDTLLLSDKFKKSPDSAILKQNVRDLIVRLNASDEKMMDWMHYFKDDFKGKTAQDDLDYYKSQMIKIREVEDGYIKVTRQSDSVLKVYNIK
ncbi:hypothetical protein G7074_24435 [Pedobacter sp. HDW13]|uniref:hypothetical protein n=1 Tax=unclassified Pedobacter TaxID=2628915 RepID=UPI000F5A70B7|nr:MULTISPECIES: hypothetical protein [unclassified Pedobacter]QIL42135.1 hypothetical protein G7074_24435 [Pedobacter sp. HDW13]RQO76631.1 hypothetical protein DBR40_12110 [Pedobacter sp. KBW01]